MPSPTRRSTRSVLPSTSKPTHASSSSSSTSSSRPERTTRAHRTSSSPPHPQMEKVIDDISENEEENGNETTRCICGSQDYPGPPSTDENQSFSEDSGSFFIQCDKCNVWQHGGCVGIMAEEHSPDNYSCEQCEKRLHQLHTDQKGQRYSLYLPVTRRTAANTRKVSMTRDNDAKLKKEREILARLGADLAGPKRRSTMNSRQNYDEEEMMRKAIEESKGDLDTGSRKTKRLRDENEDIKPHIKRQRTGSDSIEAASTLHTGSVEADSDDDAPQTTTKSAMKRARAAAAENQRQKEMRERERARDQQREEAAGRRQARAGRRRGDGRRR
ncbi:hypothetical protein K461DRAFT_105285 [Myriangium duriaei CBS 260.36]|uniref:Zinc finger PHD-type domain-containing protein n=1 Tax=Myriangium duriaei CBS 260.36 TaxID=1168546 RepID=A0A9P4J9M6_9PEZI|nr:hypothetical protein K461DRAFT_105285 [Myriangium duriaei CBS 260.36]